MQIYFEYIAILTYLKQNNYIVYLYNMEYTPMQCVCITCFHLCVPFQMQFTSFSNKEQKVCSSDIMSTLAVQVKLFG